MQKLYNCSAGLKCLVALLVFMGINTGATFSQDGITAVRIYDQNSDAAVAAIPALTDGMEVDISLLPEDYYLVVETTGQAGSVRIYVNGNQRVENHVLYTYPSGAENGNSWNAGPGEYDITAKSYEENGCQGFIDEVELSFSIVESNAPCGSITGFQLVNSDTGEALFALNDNDRIDVSSLPQNYHIEILTEGNIESVVTDVNGEERTENYYTWDYPNGGGAWNAGIGDYIISSTAYSEDNGGGTECDAFAICLFIDPTTCEYNASTDDCVYETSDTDQCNADQGSLYQLWIAGEGRATTVGTTTFTENEAEGTAQYTGTFQLGSDVINVDVVYSGATTQAPSGSPKAHFCEDYNASEWKYYPEVCGTLESQLYGTFYITRKGPAFQLGDGANVTSRSGRQLGASGWFYLTSDSNCPAYTEGDFNFNLSGGCVSVCCEDVSMDCPGDQVFQEDPTIGGANVLWPVPTATTNSCRSNLTVTQIEGPENGSFIASGEVVTITYQVDECGTTCSFDVEVVPASTTPSPCSDLVLVVAGWDIYIGNTELNGANEVRIISVNTGELVFYEKNQVFNHGETNIVQPTLPIGLYRIEVISRTDNSICSGQLYYSPQE